MNMVITENFSLSEFEKSETAERLGIDNRIPNEAQLNLRTLCAKVLQPLRDLYGKPLTISSGYRCEELNRAVGGVPTSQHRLGEAADVTCDAECGMRNAELLRLWRLLISDDSKIEFDQAILYRKKGFIHISYTSKRENRRQMIVTKERS